jgi:hypothetical protein
MTADVTTSMNLPNSAAVPPCASSPCTHSFCFHLGIGKRVKPKHYSAALVLTATRSKRRASASNTIPS